MAIPANPRQTTAVPASCLWSAQFQLREAALDFLPARDAGGDTLKKLTDKTLLATVSGEPKDILVRHAAEQRLSGLLPKMSMCGELLYLTDEHSEGRNEHLEQPIQEVQNTDC